MTLAFQRRELLRMRARKTSNEKHTCREWRSEKTENRTTSNADAPRAFLSGFIRDPQVFLPHKVPPTPGHVQTQHSIQGKGWVSSSVSNEQNNKSEMNCGRSSPCYPPSGYSRTRVSGVPIWLSWGPLPSWRSGENTRSSSLPAVYPKSLQSIHWKFQASNRPSDR